MESKAWSTSLSEASSALDWAAELAGTQIALADRHPSAEGERASARLLLRYLVTQ